jgi:molecular chaperone GrpE
LQADFLNLQRNSAREREKTRDFAITNFAADLLETVDVLSLALKSVPRSALSSQAPDVPPLNSAEPVPEPTPALDSSLPPPPTKTADEYLRELYTGVDMTQRQLLQTLFKYHVKPFDPTGDPFDPNRHEALYQAPIPGATPGTVIDCQKTGYTIRDRVLRAAQVGVAQETQS